MKNLIDIKQDFENYFNTDYASDIDDSIKNTEIRNELIDFIFSQKSIHNKTALEAIRFLIENTGCQEDLAIYQKIRPDLLNAGIISKDVLTELEKLMPTNRW
jgi:hypothetical protein